MLTPESHFKTILSSSSSHCHRRRSSSSSRPTNSVAPQTEGYRRQHRQDLGTLSPSLTVHVDPWSVCHPGGGQPGDPRVSFLLSLRYKVHLLYTSKFQAHFLPVAAQRPESSAWSYCMTCLSSSILLALPSRACVGCLWLRRQAKVLKCYPGFRTASSP